MNARGILLAQAEAPTTAAALFTATIETEITRVVLCNTSGAARAIRMHHDDTGSAAFTASNAVLWDESLTAAQTKLFDSTSENVGFSLARGGRVAFEADGTGVTVTLYGVTSNVGYSGVR